MGIREDIKTYLGAKMVATIGDRLYADDAPTGAIFPYVVYRTVIENSDQTFEKATELGKEIFQFDGVSDNPTVSADLGTQIRFAFDNFKGPMGNGPTFVQGSFIQSQRTSKEDPKDGTQNYYHHRVVDVKFMYRRSSPIF